MTEGFLRKDHLLHGALKRHNEALARKEAEENPPVQGPITACIGAPETFSKEDSEALAALQSEFVDYKGSRGDARELNQTRGMDPAYVISALSNTNKHSNKYINCIGAALVVTDVATGKNISLLSHQHVLNLIGKSSQKLKDQDFRDAFSNLLHEFMRRTEKGTRDAVIFGGNYFRNERARDANMPTSSFADNYVDAVKVLSATIAEVIGLDAHVVVGPQTRGGDIDVTLDTQNRRLYIVRLEQPGFENNVNFPASKIDEYIPLWDKEEKRRSEKK